ncbi:ABC transporter [Thioflexithrix psekupsensis]|uniref:ABC transporter n=1 Tax=Thioflexithrix psekupsensis TaxID=1570016 RepID=A0A251X680_9GAMM|nr:ABC transporter [Thioflexithrix psekupsensis]
MLLPLQGSLSGCASLSTSPDPLEPLNRRIFGFNQAVDEVILKPLAVTYQELTPEPVNQGITNFFSNLSELSVIANDLLQFKLKQAASDSGRFVINTTLGLLGFLDLATHFGYPKNYEDFGQTLGYWGVGSGPYLVLPLLGPSSIRDTAGRGVDGFFDPRSYVAGNDDVVLRWHVITNGIYAVDQRASLLEIEKVMKTAALDPYTYMRDAYLQRREYLVKDGNVPTQEDEFDELFSDLE